MNLYFLVEGFTESAFYPKFIEHYFDGKISPVDNHLKAVSNNYYLIGDGGYPYIYTGSKLQERGESSLKNSILEINENPVFNYLIICLDADESTVKERREELDNYLEKFRKDGITLNDYCQILLVVQNRCIETWFLGNKKAYKNNPSTEPLISYAKYYNVKENDPELMGNYRDEYTHQDFHLQYLRAMFRERRWNYKKELPDTASSKEYIQQLEKRVHQKDAPLSSLKLFFDFCAFVKSKLVE